MRNLTDEIGLTKIHARETILNLSGHLNEAQLVQSLEKQGIGRPSTFSSIVDKIQVRGYVTKTNVEGKQMSVTELVLDGDVIRKTTSMATFGNEKNRLVITPLGQVVTEFLYTYFDDLFKNDFTQNMEMALDAIKDGTKDHIVYLNEFKTFVDSLMKTQKQLLPKKDVQVVNETYTYLLTKHGPCLSYLTEDNKNGYINLKPNTTYDMCLDNMDDLTSLYQPKKIERNLGEYLDKIVMLKSGQYGVYVAYDDKTISLKELRKPFDEIHMGDVIDMLDQDMSVNPNLVREINSSTSIRKSKYGNYIFYQTTKMKKPKFIKLAGFTSDIMTCSKELVERFVKSMI